MKRKTTSTCSVLRLTSVKKAFLRSIILFFPNAGKGNFPNETLPFPKGCWKQEGGLLLALCPQKSFLLQHIWFQIVPMSELTALEESLLGLLAQESPTPGRWNNILEDFTHNSLTKKTRIYSSVSKYVSKPVTFSDKDLCLSWAPQPRRWSDNLTLSPNKGDQTLQEAHR